MESSKDKRIATATGYVSLIYTKKDTTCLTYTCYIVIPLLEKKRAVITAVFEDLHLTWQIFRNTFGKIRRYTLRMASLF